MDPTWRRTIILKFSMVSQHFANFGLHVQVGPDFVKSMLYVLFNLACSLDYGNNMLKAILVEAWICNQNVVLNLI